MAGRSHRISATISGIQNELVIFQIPGKGRAVAVLPVVPDRAPYMVREGLARRRITAITGECPCGARGDYAAGIAGADTVQVQHEQLCPAQTDRLVKAIRRWQR